jgi:glycerol-3-phosphate acyltransferase PlsX
LAGPIAIALDAMGGDRAPEIVVRGAELARERRPELKVLLFGDEARIAPLLARAKRLQGCAEIRHTAVAVTADDKPSQALRKGRESSMGLAIEAVASGQAAGVVSAGNTGALMALSKFVLRPLPGIDRPALAALFPTIRGESVMLDLGANVQCDANNLVQFALMGAAFARTVMGLPRPTVGLLNVGEEELKGNDVVKAAAQILRASSLSFDFRGFVEGDGIPQGATDVVVTDGFTGNVALKTAEGTAKLYTQLLRQALKSSWTARLGYLLARGAFDAMRDRVDPRYYNGGVFLGLNGVSVKSHGGTDATGFATAIDIAVDMAAGNLAGRIIEDLKQSGREEPPQERAAS